MPGNIPGWWEAEDGEAGKDPNPLLSQPPCWMDATVGYSVS